MWTFWSQRPRNSPPAVMSTCRETPCIVHFMQHFANCVLFWKEEANVPIHLIYTKYGNSKIFLKQTALPSKPLFYVCVWICPKIDIQSTWYCVLLIFPTTAQKLSVVYTNFNPQMAVGELLAYIYKSFL